MHPLAVLLKSYAKDRGRAGKLVASFRQHNRENLPLFLAVPDDDIELFRPLADSPERLIPESSFADHLVTEPLWGLRPGYINQEIIKLAFGETGLAANFFCADSELVFVRDFGFDDFMADETTPYTVLVEDNELKVEPRYYAEHWQGREEHLRRIQALVGLDDRRLLTCHGHQVMSSAVIGSLRRDFMDPRGWDFRDLLAESPYEFSWYNFWLQKSRVIPIVHKEPLVKTFHHEGQQLEYALRGISHEDVARGFLGVVVNSNFGAPADSAGDSAATLLARHVDARTLARALALQATSSVRSRLGLDASTPDDH